MLYHLLLLLALTASACGDSGPLEESPSIIAKRYLDALWDGNMATARTSVATFAHADLCDGAPRTRWWDQRPRDHTSPARIIREMHVEDAVRVVYTLHPRSLDDTPAHHIKGDVTLARFPPTKAEPGGWKVVGDMVWPWSRKHDPQLPVLIDPPFATKGVATHWQELLFHVWIGADGRRFLADGRPVDLKGLGAALAGATRPPETRGPDRRCLLVLVLIADRSASWSLIEEVIRLTSAAPNYIYKIGFGCRGGGHLWGPRFLSFGLPCEPSRPDARTGRPPPEISATLRRVAGGEDSASRLQIEIGDQDALHPPTWEPSSPYASISEREQRRHAHREALRAALAAEWERLGSDPACTSAIRVEGPVHLGEWIEAYDTFVGLGLSDLRSPGLACPEPPPMQSSDGTGD